MVEELIAKDDIIDILEHTNGKYLQQKMFIVRLKGYLCRVPFVENDKEIFLKTIFPDRKLKKIYEKEEE
jgi:Flp pilus assembly CpaF family ATPase